jgi:hypothetical protein
MCFIFVYYLGRQKSDINICNKCSERVTQFIYLRTTVTNQHSFHEKIKSRLKSGTACYHSV